MALVPVMWTVWSALVILMACLHLYRSTLARDEEGQIFLDESFNHEKAAQETIVAKVNKIEPMLKALQWAVGVMTAIVVAYYIYDILVQLNVIHS